MTDAIHFKLYVDEDGDNYATTLDGAFTFGNKVANEWLFEILDIMYGFDRNPQSKAFEVHMVAVPRE